METETIDKIIRSEQATKGVLNNLILAKEFCFDFSNWLQSYDKELTVNKQREREREREREGERIIEKEREKETNINKHKHKSKTIQELKVKYIEHIEAKNNSMELVTRNQKILLGKVQDLIRKLELDGMWMKILQSDDSKIFSVKQRERERERERERKKERKKERE